MSHSKQYDVATKQCRAEHSPKLHHRSLGLLHQHLYQTGWRREERTATIHVAQLLRSDRFHRTRLTRERLQSNTRFRKQGSRFHS